MILEDKTVKASYKLAFIIYMKSLAVTKTCLSQLLALFLTSLIQKTA
jgi:hypothetical protein